ncbi:MAG TPA: stage II sporulation protein M [Candidatus Nanoarchaeia archaeon]|nr:stage II sporulation protein M [Candidatus Nanoarchaeia archaeon]
MFEEFLEKIGKRKIYATLLGLLYVLVSFGTAQIFFTTNVSIAMMFFITLLLVPSTTKLIALEEDMERRDGLNHFARDHYVIIETFLFLAIGIFIGYLLVGQYNGFAIKDQKEFLNNQGAFSVEHFSEIEKIPQLLSIITNNISVVLIAFVLSLFYGVGALFLIVRNASIVAAFVLGISDAIQKSATVSAVIFSIHFIPEIAGFLIAALAGGVLSKAFMHEKIGSYPFKNVVKDSTMLLGLAVLCIVGAALLEVFVTPQIILSIL